MKIIKIKNRELLDLSLVLAISITFSLFSISINFIDRLNKYFEIYTTLPIAEFLLNVIFLWLIGLLWITYRRWRRAVKRQKELESIISSISPDALIVVDTKRNIIMCNTSVKRMFGYEVEEVINQKTDLLYYDRRSDSSIKHEIYNALETIGFHTGLATGRKKNNDTIPLEIVTAKLRGREGAVLLLRDISERKRAEEELKQQAAFVKNNPAPVLQAGNDGKIVRFNPSAKKVFKKDLKEESLQNLFPEINELFVKNIYVNDPFQFERRIDELTFLFTIKRDELTHSFYVYASDITDRKQVEEKLNELATTDDLTKLLNRRQFMEVAEHEIKRAKRYGRPLSLLVMDVDYFKSINDTYGHDVGDSVLRALADVSRNILRQIDILGRIGGDEFAVLLPETSFEDTLIIAERLRQVVASTIVSTSQDTLALTVSLGVTTLKDETQSLPTLLKNADIALYAAKESSRNKVEAYESLISSQA